MSAMSTLEDLVRHKAPYSGLAFRKAIYGPEDDAQVVIDCLGFANTELKGRRFLFFGVDNNGGTSRRFLGVDRSELKRFKQRFDQLIADFIEPHLTATVRAVQIDDHLIGYIRIKDCSARPYLAKQSLGRVLQEGVGYIRQGAKNYPLQRVDMQRMFSQSEAAVENRHSIHIGFQGDEPIQHLTLPVLALGRIPSELAAEQLTSLLEARGQTRQVLGHTETKMLRLMHAKFYGVDVPFRKRSDDSLEMALKNVEGDFRLADKHYEYEARSHKLNLTVANDRETNLHNAVLRVTLPQMEGIDVADRIYTEDETKPAPEGYPTIERGRRTVSLKAKLGTLYAKRGVTAFREPARLLVRQEAAGKAVPVDYALQVEELPEPIKGSLVIYVDTAILKSA